AHSGTADIPEYDIDRGVDPSSRLYAWEPFERLSRCHPAAPLVVYVPVIIALLWQSTFSTEMGVAAVVGWTLTGLLTWSLTEYWLHRMLFHLTGVSEGLKLFHRRIHGIHHEFPNDMTRVVFPPIASLFFASIFYSLFYAMVGAQLTMPLFAGFAVGYLWYDMTHWWTHAGKPRSAWGKMVRRHHMTHHFKTPDRRFGVSTPLWDLVFRTL
ncbi:MAG: sterol desaturase family protein, partial [Myxococcota bacterium]|nr:sterol desaturase family protein [Myxococcota bacterium]